MAKPTKEHLRGERQRSARARGESSRLRERAREVIDKARNVLQVTVYRRNLRDKKK